MKYKMIFSDFDGTIASDDHSISDENKRAIKEYQQKGGTFVLCSGRAPLPAWSIVEELGIENNDIPIAGLNGALVFNKDKEVIYKAPIKNSTAYIIVKEAESRGIYCHMYDDYTAIIAEEHPINIDYRKITGIDLTPVGKLSDYLMAHPDFDPVKILYVIDPCISKELDEVFDRLNLPGVTHVMSNDTFYEFISTDAGKEKAMKFIANEYGVDISEVIAIGDNFNDKAMIEQAGLGVAIGNGRAETIAVADFVATSNNESAIAQVVDKFCKE